MSSTQNTNLRDDEIIKKEIEQRLRTESTLENSDITVQVENGEVVLKGELPTSKEAACAVELAGTVAGVTDIDASKLEVEGSSQPLTDSFITAKVKSSFIREKLFGEKPINPMSISVVTSDGVVYLSGTAERSTQVNNAKKLASEIKGVKKVISNVELEEQLA